MPSAHGGLASDIKCDTNCDGFQPAVEKWCVQWHKSVIKGTKKLGTTDKCLALV